ncbi:H+-transporting two-sector ATPase, B/B' subunit [Afipia carboxidovorans OM5]|uniref:ATP synthase subunit b 1 n=1 Tax=Afipia carboxidovorans (strain ATCC 49405 / DSM 1227 / KCTC 32145 / OM5) TaxID=504832 RepID=ATPF1_AFIC5|nr:ATP synthase subunit b 1 [Afipia carboxidovorans]B6JDC7.1 RecName: Full=ATP synthase subunit b 1; AltName: Full=ATP synthase F(0) sector subunit b 1; AltName: Full=ATPase subunit I 1; AltName: Full=F-type ATPase subunit b 1; Short=F-ATPase subunit b 1 [Afipia carboxidovorans OM5]ACI91839.1 H+-transporting two-sector ATPase, B/B' subunit [Afipia carboxidovorans OM5]AEI04299.1 ATP synthase subunit b [Afipia carboxidovorans OM4]AEI07929.1 ATP synthase subunit b [Afipia carboxidovorans OM5]
MLHEAETWVAVAFVLMVALFIYFGAHRMIGEALDRRSARIRKELDDARQLKEEAQKLVAEYRSRRESAEREAQEIVAAAQADAERIAQEAKAKMEDFVARRTKAAESKIAQAETQAVADVRAAAAEAAAAAAANVLSQTVKGSIADNLIEKSIRELGGKLN